MNIEKEKIAIERVKAFEPEDGYYLAYSGGKDSDCIKILAYLAGVKFEAVHNLTTVDAPETVYYIRSQEDVRIDKPKKSMWQLIVDKGLPPTKHRYFEFERYPRYKALYIKTFDRMVKARAEKGLTNRVGWQTGKDVYKWWMGEDPLQLTFEEFEDY